MQEVAGIPDQGGINSTQEKGIDDVLVALHLLLSSSGEDDSSHKEDSGEDNWY